MDARINKMAPFLSARRRGGRNGRRSLKDRMRSLLAPSRELRPANALNRRASRAVSSISEVRHGWTRIIPLHPLPSLDSRSQPVLHVERVLRACGLDRFFDSVHISTRVGAAKPDPAIFQAALNYYGIEPGQTWHVGDSLREDVEGALAAGLKAFLIDRRGEQRSAAGYVSLSSLPQLLKMF